MIKIANEIKNLKLTVMCSALLTVFSASNSLAQRCEPCEALNKVILPNTSIKAQWIEAGKIPADPNSALTGSTVREVEVKAHCLVKGEIEKRIGSDGKPYAIKFELRMPEDWNGKFLFQGGGGINGFVAPAVGSVPVYNSTAVPALVRGYAVVSTDSGHQAPKGEEGYSVDFANDQQAILDYAYAAIGKVTERAKKLITLHYGKAPKHSYFMGCSNGGREAMVASQRYPNEFDGIVSGNAAFRFSCGAVGATWTYQHLMSLVPKNDKSQNESQAITARDWEILNKAVLKHFDGKDGIVDGIINDWESNDFDPAVLTKELGEQKVGVIKAIFAGAKNSQGEQLSPRFPYQGLMTSLGMTEMAQLYMRYFEIPKGGDAARFDFDKDMANIRIVAALTDADSPDLRSFKANGGKMVIYEGSGDPVFPPTERIKWYKEMNEVTGDAQSFARVFVVPHMAHCGGGQALDDIDPLSTLENWRERDEFPEYIIAKGSEFFKGRSQPVCAYPKIATYIGGDKDKAESYECRTCKL
nr:tannase/feruloyl esterase family alpha/beta hydrolase [uncultured Chryseobacterium sp.]